MSQPGREALCGSALQLPQGAVEVVCVAPELDRELLRAAPQRVVTLDPRALFGSEGHAGEYVMAGAVGGAGRSAFNHCKGRR